tara:strand:+ start:538 stop:756 length:219 start_codon:yes stop_codon:yes gene_type:complete
MKKPKYTANLELLDRLKEEREEEREACAKIADEWGEEARLSNHKGGRNLARMIASDIRARKYKLNKFVTETD